MDVPPDPNALHGLMDFVATGRTFTDDGHVARDRQRLLSEVLARYRTGPLLEGVALGLLRLSERDGAEAVGLTEEGVAAMRRARGMP